jgi:hypothetical protein
LNYNTADAFDVLAATLLPAYTKKQMSVDCFSFYWPSADHAKPGAMFGLLRYPRYATSATGSRPTRARKVLTVETIHHRLVFLDGVSYI